MGVYKHNGLLKASIMSATNAHRLGANEAPPAIISSFLGKQLTDLLEHIEKADKKDLFTVAGKQGMKLDIPEIPELMIDNTDRNRTSPFAFTGNRFEFRAVGSEANCASAMIVLNEVKWETYTKKIQIEARVMGDLSMNHIIPVATHYQSQLAKNVENMIDIFGDEEGKKLTARNINIIKKIAERTQIIETGVEELVNARKVANKIESEHDKAIAYHDTVAPKMEEIRYQIDKLELAVADELWTLPKYRELLFIR